MVNLVFRFLFITLFLIFCPWVNAAKLTLKADQTLIPMGGRVEVQFVFEGLNNSPNLGSLDIEGFQIVGRSTSSSIQFINGKKSESATITLQLRPKQTGRLTIGPYEVNFNNKKLRSNQLVIVVDASNLSKGSKNSIFIEAELDKKKLVSGEQTLYKIKVYRPVNKSNATRITFALPETSDVILEEKKSTQKKEYQKKVDGLLYQVTEISIPLFALKSGHWELPPASVTYFVKDPNRRRRRRSFFDSFFDDDLFGGRGKKKQSWSKSLKIEVQEIDAIKPQSFSGLIGQFKIEQILSQTEITSDENITLKLKVTGIGSLSDLIEIPVSLDAFKIYPDGEGDLQERKSQEGLLGGIKEFSYALVPKNAGEQKIGPFELTYYDPQRETFVTVKTQEQLVTITQGSVKAPSSIYSTLTSDQMMEAKNNTKKKVQVLKHNILPLEMDYDIRSKFFLSRNHMVVLSLLLIFFTILYELFLKKRFSFKKSGVELEYSYAMSVFNREIESELSAAKVFSDFVLRKLKIPLVEKTPEQTLEILKNKGIDTVLYDDLNQLYQREEMNRYSGRISNQLDNSQWKKLSKLIQDLF